MFAFRLTYVQWLRRCWLLLSTIVYQFLQRLCPTTKTIPLASIAMSATFDLCVLCKASGRALKALMLF